jgi:hypothetical protein
MAEADRERARSERPSRTYRYGDRASEDVSREMPGQLIRSRPPYGDGLLVATLSAARVQSPGPLMVGKPGA